MWAYILLIGVAACIAGGTGAVIFGTCFVALGLFGFANLAVGRVWIEGTALGSRPAIHLDRLTDASLSAFGRNTGRRLDLRDADGNAVSLDATNFRLVRLYAALAAFIPSGSPVANERLQHRMDKHRPGLPLGLG
jgi:hypothetical protein